MVDGLSCASGVDGGVSLCFLVIPCDALIGGIGDATTGL